MHRRAYRFFLILACFESLCCSPELARANEDLARCSSGAIDRGMAKLEEAAGDQAVDYLVKGVEEAVGFANSAERHEAWGRLGLKRLSPAEERMLLKEFEDDGRDILLVTDTNKDMTAGTVVVFKVLKNYVEKLTEGKVKVRIVDSDMFFGIKPKSKDFQNTKIALPFSFQVARSLENVQAVHIAMEGTVGLAFKQFCDARGIKYTTAYHTMRPEYIQGLVEEKVISSGSKVTDVISRVLRITPESLEKPSALVEALAKRLGVTAGILTEASMRRFHRNSEAIAVPTASMRRDLQAKQFDLERLFAWSHGVELDLFNPSWRPRAELQAEMYSGLEPPITVFVGRISQEKNVIDFLDAEIDGTKVVIGNGPDFERFRAQYPQVKFLGNRPRGELPRYLEAADVFLFPSLKDTFGLVNVEAIAMGTPAVVYNQWGPGDIIKDGVAGFVVPYKATDRAGNLRGLTEAVVKARKLDRRGVRTYAEEWDWKFSALEWLHSLSRLPKR